MGHYWQNFKYEQSPDGTVWKSKKAFWECLACKERRFKRPKDLLDDIDQDAFKTWTKHPSQNLPHYNFAPKKKSSTPDTESSLAKFAEKKYKKSKAPKKGTAPKGNASPKEPTTESISIKIPYLISFTNKEKKAYFRAVMPEGGSKYSTAIVPGRTLATVFTNEQDLWNARDQIAKDFPNLSISIEPLNKKTYTPPPPDIKVPKAANLRPLDLD